MNRVPVDLTGPPQTMLAMLYAKALDAEAPHSILRKIGQYHRYAFGRP